MEFYLKIKRRDFLKTTAAGTLLAASSTVPGLAMAKAERENSESRQDTNDSHFTTREGTIIRADMSRCLPRKNLSRNFEKNRWALIDFETVEGVKGFMTSARPDEDCGELTLPLEAEGLYKIYLGMHASKSHYRGSSSYGQMEVKLTHDQGFRRVGPEDETKDEDGTTKFGDDDPNIDKSITEAYWKTAELSGQSLIFRQMPYPYNRPEHGRLANLSYVRLVPLTEEETIHWKKLQPRDETKKLALIFCTGQFTGHTRGTYTFHPTSKEFFEDEIEPFINSDFKILIFEALRGSSCVYNTKIGSLGTEDNVWQDEWVDPLGELTRLAHGNGMKIFASMRFIGPQFPMNRSPIAWAPNYWRHPEWTMRTKEGVPITNLSLAYPEVCNYWLSLLRETLDYGTDGVQIHLNRSEPYVFYEKPVLDAFQQKYGQDPRQLDVEDPKWLEHTSGYLTQFIREIRKLVDEKPGRSLGVTISGRKNGREVHYEENQCDVESWIKEGLVNYIMTTPYLHPSLLKKWRNLGGNRLHIWPDVMPRSQTAASYAKTAKKYYQAGADGLCFWDGERRTARISEWAAARSLGHTNKLDYLIKTGPSYYRAVALKKLGGFDVKWSFKDG
jgi:hypothetical protein